LKRAHDIGSKPQTNPARAPFSRPILLTATEFEKWHFEGGVGEREITLERVRGLKSFLVLVSLNFDRPDFETDFEITIAGI
jgi:hypothetical protein